MKYAMINDENVLVYVLMLCHLITLNNKLTQEVMRWLVTFNILKSLLGVGSENETTRKYHFITINKNIRWDTNEIHVYMQQ